ncbi:interferon-induced protein 44-like [Colossoma macropomum]|uniref:interferon-induced protein 44-like n=1 Tax=Colossoma macropomum TaxID=42526 RepID=UPI0018653DDA|nr:interferon-induced protein 44-like [Colossoma macropomum]
MGSTPSTPSTSPTPSTPPKPECVSVLADKQVKEGQGVTLQCEANTGEVTAKWEKNGHRLECVEGKHTRSQSGTAFSLTIKNTAKEDEGNYTINLQNDSGSASCSAMVIVELNEWRTAQRTQDPMIKTLKNFDISNSEVRELRFLLHGPVGAGKSSTINTIKTIFDGHQFINCLAASDLSGESFTTKYQRLSVGSSPFAFYDVMGLEKDQKQDKRKQPKGVHSDDIINALKGHIPNDYEFIPEQPMSEDNVNYISDPTLNDKIHCLVSVIAADKVTLMEDDVIQKMKTIRAGASKLGIPQLVFMTRVDKVCKMTQNDLTKIYQSKKIKEKMEECSIRLGVPMNCIFPLKNYHEETNMNEKLNCLMLEAFTQAVHSAHEYVKNVSHKKKNVE